MESANPVSEQAERRDGPDAELEGVGDECLLRRRFMIAFFFYVVFVGLVLAVGSLRRIDLGAEDPPCYPVRQDRMDCSYYMRTGRCGYGANCRFNHPRDRRTVARPATTGSEEHPQRINRPACRYFLKHGTCKYGDTCKYEHLKQDGFMPLAYLNKWGYPLRPGEKDCSFYIRTGCCKFGFTCKFNHPDLSLATMPLPPSPAYPILQPPIALSTQQYSVIPNWEFAAQSVLPASIMQGPYGSVILFPGIMPDSSSFLATASTVGCSGGQHTNIQGESQYSLAEQVPHSEANTQSHPIMPSPVGPSANNKTEHMLPERLDESQCQECKREGYCELNSRCKYHLPPENNPP